MVHFYKEWQLSLQLLQHLQEVLVHHLCHQRHPCLGVHQSHPYQLDPTATQQ